MISPIEQKQHALQDGQKQAHNPQEDEGPAHDQDQNSLGISSQKKKGLDHVWADAPSTSLTGLPPLLTLFKVSGALRLWWKYLGHRKLSSSGLGKILRQESNH